MIFTLIPIATQYPCPEQGCRGSVLKHQAWDVDDKGRLVRCTLTRTNPNPKVETYTIGGGRALVPRTASGRTVSTVEYTSCTNHKCVLHLTMTKRRADDADEIFALIQEARHSRQPWKRR